MGSEEVPRWWFTSFPEHVDRCDGFLVCRARGIGEGSWGTDVVRVVFVWGASKPTAKKKVVAATAAGLQNVQRDVHFCLGCCGATEISSSPESGFFFFFSFLFFAYLRIRMGVTHKCPNAVDSCMETSQKASGNLAKALVTTPSVV